MSRKNVLTDQFVEAIKKESPSLLLGDLKYYLKELFRGVAFRGKTMLDIGSGVGIYSSFAAYAGAKRVVCLEPEDDGGRDDAIKKATALANALALKQILICSKRIQDFDSRDENFDIILLHASINHLDENACINLRNNKDSVKKYLEIFKKIYKLSNKGARIIITDCSRYNFFALLNIKNPFAKNITWQKHQSPYLWAELLQKAGFVNPKIYWISPSKLGKLGKVLLDNRIISYFINSKFCLTLEK